MSEHPDSASGATNSSVSSDKYFGKRLTQPKIRAVPGFFYQSEDPDKLGLSEEERAQCLDRFGLLDSSPDGWSKFEAEISKLNREAEPDKTYKVIYAMRHGFAEHNELIEEYKKRIRDAPGAWSKLMGLSKMCNRETISKIFTSDPPLTELGVQQAEQLNERLRAQIQSGMPPPEDVYASTLDRSLCTTEIGLKRTCAGVTHIQASDRLRERAFAFMKSHQRNDKSEIEKRHVRVVFEEGLPERDALFSYWQNETDPDFHRRVGSGIAAICTSTSSTFLAMVSHRMTTDEFLSSVGHRPWQLKTADMVPVVLEITGVPCDHVKEGPGGLKWQPKEQWVSLNETTGFSTPPQVVPEDEPGSSSEA